MATKLGLCDSRPLKRETAPIDHGKPIIVCLEANGAWLAFREKGRRQWYRLPIMKAYWEAIKLHVAERKAAKLAERLARRQAKKRGAK